MPTNALTDYLALAGSTTRFLERRSGKSVTASVHLQTMLRRGKLIERISTLHVGSSAPVLAAKCLLDLTHLTEEEIARLTATTDPIGGILLDAGGADLRRENLSLQRVERHPLAHFLSVDTQAYHVKSFELWQGERFIGDLEEVVCAESFARIDASDAAPTPKTSAV